jgi:hypothetical protein
MEGRERPIHYTIDMAVLDRVEVDVIDVTGEIVLVTRSVLPITALLISAVSNGRGNSAGQILVRA